MIVLIFENRIKRVYADIRQADRTVVAEGNAVVIGQMVDELTNVWTSPIGNVAMDESGSLWLDRASLYSTDDSWPIPNAYLACSIESFQRVAQLNCEAGKLAMLPRSQQWRYMEAQAAFREWVESNDPRCLDDPGSYWSELWSDEY